jgi:hypothetical protein
LLALKNHVKGKVFQGDFESLAQSTAENAAGK